jgi:hypothetical protein
MVEGRSRRRWVVAGVVVSLVAAAIVAAVVVLTGNARDQVKTDSTGIRCRKTRGWSMAELLVIPPDCQMLWFRWEGVDAT